MSQEKDNEFQTTNKLGFYSAPWATGDLLFAGNEFRRFRVGTCFGIYRSTSKSYDILGIENDEPGNGHFNDVLEWFEHSCKRDLRCLRILEITNARFYLHLIAKRGFQPCGGINLEKHY